MSAECNESSLQEYDAEEKPLAHTEASEEMTTQHTGLALIPAEGSSTLLMTMINLITSGLGAGILSLPWASAGASVLIAALITGFALLINGGTCMILVEASEKYQVFDIGSLLGRLPGKGARAAQAISNILVWVSMFMCVIGYLIIIADVMQPLGRGPLASREAWIVMGSLLILPLSYLDLKYLSFTSALIIIFNVYLFGFMLYLILFTEAPSKSEHAVCFIGLGKGSVAMFSNLIMAVVVQSQVLPMYQSLKSRSIRRFRAAIYGAFSFLCILFVGFQTVALVYFGPKVQSNVLQNLPSTVGGYIARFGMAGIMPGVAPLKIMSMVAPVRVARRGGAFAANVTTFGIVMIAMLVSFFVDKLGTMNVLTGALSVIGLVSICPALVGLYLVGRSKVIMIVLVAFGCIMCALALVLNDNYEEQIQSSCVLN